MRHPAAQMIKYEWDCDYRAQKRGVLQIKIWTPLYICVTKTMKDYM